MRKLHHVDGGVPYHSVGTAVCVHPVGIVLTCTHTVESFLDRIGPYGSAEAQRLSHGSNTIPAEDEEKLYFCFAFDLKGRAPVLRRGVPSIRFQMFTVHRAVGSVNSDVCALLLSPTAEHQPLPHVEVARRIPSREERVSYAGHFRPANTPLDGVGHPTGHVIQASAAKVVAPGEGAFLIDTYVERGMSGGPVLDESGALLGIIRERWSPELTMRRVGLPIATTMVAGHPYPSKYLAQALADPH